MAGAGYKLFNTGDVLTAAQVNTYLMQQTVMVFASSAARTSALSGVLAEGMVSYLQDSNTLEVYDGSAWVGATGDITGLTAGTGISISSATGPVPTITSDVATTFDAKGDLVVGTGADTFSKLTVGANGETIVADSSTSTGLRWQSNFAAGKNKIINGDFGIWQRGTSFTSSGVYTADRFLTNTDAGVTVSQQTFTPGTAPVAGYEGQYFLRWAKSAGGSYLDLAQRIEDVRTFAGQTVTLSFWARVSSGTASVEPYYVQDFGTGGSSAVAGALTAQTINTSWARYSFNLAVPSVSGKTIGTSSRLQISPLRILTASAVTADIWGVQLEAGNTATAFQTATGTLAGELQAAQRYYYVLADAANQTFGTAAYFSASDVLGTVFFPVTMRTAPTFSAAAGSYYEVVRNSATDGLTGLQANYLSTRAANVFAGSGEGASGTAGHGGQYRTTSASANIAFSAEL